MPNPADHSASYALEQNMHQTAGLPMCSCLGTPRSPPGEGGGGVQGYDKIHPHALDIKDAEALIPSASNDLLPVRGPLQGPDAEGEGHAALFPVVHGLAHQHVKVEGLMDVSHIRLAEHTVPPVPHIHLHSICRALAKFAARADIDQGCLCTGMGL